MLGQDPFALHEEEVRDELIDAKLGAPRCCSSAARLDRVLELCPEASAIVIRSMISV